MHAEIELVMPPEEAAMGQLRYQYAAALIGIEASQISHLQVLKRSIDARGKQVKFRMRCLVFWDEVYQSSPSFSLQLKNVEKGSPVLIVGAGPAGLFAALKLIELGYKPLIFERGKDVQARRRDLRAINQFHKVDPDSNYCFGEGGAGTYSDGKLYTRSHKRGSIENILNVLVAHGADPDILVDAHPHIGTNKLPKLVAALRQTIIDQGGEVYFERKVNGFIIKNKRITGITTSNREQVEGVAVILATGHSARDIFYLLHEQNILIEAKPFALGVRIEHPQDIVDRAQYHCDVRGPYLPAASYSLVEQVMQRGVYSFCMCPGGFIVPAATKDGEIVVNGMSPSRRDSRFANSGTVVAVELEDLGSYSKYGNLAALKFQEDVEQQAFKLGGGGQHAPAQRLVDFVKNKVSATLPECSYQPGLTSVQLTEVLPDFIGKRLQAALPLFDKKIKGYYTNEAVVVGVESRTSSPLRIPRDSVSLQHPEVEGLFPCAEGAGYAGGIVSAAMDGERCAEAVKRYLKN